MQETVLRPMSKPTFSPALPSFAGNVSVSLSPGNGHVDGVELRFTIDGTDPTRNSSLYTKPIVLTSTTGIKARAFCTTDACAKLAPRSDWAADGTRFSAIAYGTYVKSDPQPASVSGIRVRAQNRGLCAVVANSTGSWSELFSFAGSHEHAGAPMGVTPLPLQPVAPSCLLDASKPSTYYSTEWSGYFTPSVAGIWSFQAPKEYSGPNVPAGYDLRLWLDGKEVALVREIGGIGAAWQAPLSAGQHPFRMVLSDARCFDSTGQNVAGAVAGLWRDFPSPWCLYNGSASAMTVTLPGDTRSRPLDHGWFSNDGCTTPEQT